MSERCSECGGGFRDNEVRHWDGVDEHWHDICPDPVSKPEHYNWHPSGVECKDIAEAFGYYLGNAIKYIWRADYKGKPIEDLQKARNCIDLELQRRAKQ